MKNVFDGFTIRARLTGAFLIVAILCGVVGTMGVLAVVRIDAMLHEVYDDNLVPISDVANANMQSIHFGRTLYEYIIENNKPGREKLAEEMRGNEKAMQALLDDYRKTHLMPDETALLSRFDAEWPLFKAAARKVTQAADAGDNAAAGNIMRELAAPAFDEVEGHLSKLVEINRQLATKANADSDALEDKIRLALIAATAMALVAAVVFGFAITRSITRPLKVAAAALDDLAQGNLSGRVDVGGKDEIAGMMRSLANAQEKLTAAIRQIIADAEQVAGSANELSASAEQVSVSTQTQSESTSSAAAAVEELSVSIDQVSQHANDASARATRAGETANGGGREVSEATRQISQVSERVSETSQQILDLSAKVQRIGSITVVIKEVADQTNLLALNAAIEAARAGEQGRGFAVVADEVRKLAERTTKSVQEITDMIQTVQSGAETAESSMKESNDLVRLVAETAHRASGSMREIEANAETVTRSVSDISSALGEQRHATNELAKRVESIAQMSEENSAAVEEVARASLALVKVSSSLEKVVGQFRIA